jgi:hypothetical protein
MEESLLKSNFLGRDGFRWWIGQVAPEKVQKQLNKDGWGNRLKVRIMGYHPYSVAELPDKDLPWAQILLSTSDGTGSSNYATSHKVRPSDIVFGFFLDGDNAQIPVISGCFGKTSQVPSEDYAGPFMPFTGYTTRITNDGSRIVPDQTNEQTKESQKSPYYLPPQTANSIPRGLSWTSIIGDTLQLGTTKPGSKMEKISTELENAIKYLQDLKSFPNLASNWIDDKVEELCDQISQKIQGIATEIVSGAVNGTYEKLEPALQQGVAQVYDIAAAAVPTSKSGAHLAGVEAQKATIEPIKQLQKLIPCLIASIIESLGGLISDMVCALLENVANVVTCVIDQFLGGLLNGIIDLIIAGMSAVLGVLSFILSFSNFNLVDTVTQLASGLLGISLSLNCGEEETDPGVEKWTIGSGPTQSSSFDINDILDLANTASAIASDPESGLSGIQGIIGPLDFLNPGISDPDFIGSGLSNCFGGIPTVCNPPSINIFGGGGIGASALPIFGSISGDTGSIIGAILTSGGSGYTYPPFVSITDNCGKGYGAVAQSVIENGQVTAIVMNSDGEGYTLGNQPQVGDIIGTGVDGGTDTGVDGGTDTGVDGGTDTGVDGGTDTGVDGGTGDTNTTLTDQQNITISEVLILNPGYNYQSGDAVTDNFGNQYNVVIDNGSIVSITPINISDITDLPILRVVSKTGSGAKLKPVFGFRNSFQGEIKQVIDCVV